MFSPAELSQNVRRKAPPPKLHDQTPLLVKRTRIRASGFRGCRDSLGPQDKVSIEFQAFGVPDDSRHNMLFEVSSALSMEVALKASQLQSEGGGAPGFRV